MRRSLLLTASQLAMALPAYAAFHGSSAGAPPPPSCNTYVADLANDGCSSAPAGTMSDPTPFAAPPNGWQQSGQTFVATPGYSYTSASHPPPFNLPGVDYPVGQITATGSMRDPATVSIAGCTYFPFSATRPGAPVLAGDPLPQAWAPSIALGAFGYPPMLYCRTNGADINISQINFGNVGSHGGTILFLSPSSINGNFTVNDNHFEMTQEITTWITGGGAGGSPAVIGSDQYNSNPVNITFTSNTVIGHAFDACCTYTATGSATYGAAPPPYPARSIYGLSYRMTGGQLIDEYNWYQDFPGQLCLQTGGTAIHKWNYVRNFQRTVTQGHGEWCGSGGLTSQTYQHNMIIATSSNGAVWDAAINMGNSNHGGTTGTTLIDSNTFIINANAGIVGKPAPNMTGSITAGVYTTSAAGPTGFSAQINGGINPQGAGFHAYISGTGGSGTTLSIDCGVGLDNVICPYNYGNGSYLDNTPRSAAVAGASLVGTCPGVSCTEILQATTTDFASNTSVGYQTVDVAGITPSNMNISSVTLAAPSAVTGGSISGSTVTLNTTGNFVVGQYINVASVNPSDWNKSNAVVTAAVPGTSVSYTNSSATSITYTSGGTIDGTVYRHNVQFINPLAVGPYSTGGVIGGVVNTYYMTGGQVFNYIAGNIIDAGHGTYTNSTITNNYMDQASLQSPTVPFQVRSPSDTTCTFPTSFSGNINMNTGAASNGWGGGVGSTGC